MRSMKSVFAFSVMLTLIVSIFNTHEASATHGGGYETKANILFEENTGAGPEVLDPEKPVIDKPVIPTDPDVKPGTNGPLSIDYVSNFHFGSQIINGNGATYYAELPEIITSDGQVKNVTNYLQVTDDRANGKGWTLSVKQEGQFKAGQDVLEGAELSMTNLTSISPISKQGPKAFNVKLDPSGTNTSTVLIAEEKTGMGTWLTRFGKDEGEGAQSIALSVPAEQVIAVGKDYKTKLQWILTDAPI